MWTQDHHVAFNIVQNGFIGAWQRELALKIANTEGRVMALRFAMNESMIQQNHLAGFLKRLQGKFYSRLDRALLQEFKAKQNERIALELEMQQFPALRGVGLNHQGVPIYWYSLPHMAFPQSMKVIHKDAECLVAPLKALKVWLHQTHTPYQRDKLFPLTWGFMKTAHSDKEPNVVLGYADTDGNSVCYTEFPITEVLQQMAL